MPVKKIDLALAKEIAEDISKCEYRIDVYKKYPFNQTTIVSALRRYGLWEGKKGEQIPITIETILEYKDQIESGEISCTRLAKKLGFSQPYIYNLARAAGVKFFYTAANRGRRKSVSDETAQSVLDHLVEKGGTIASACRDLGLGDAKHKQAVRSYAIQIGFDTRPWRYAHQRFGLWKILPGIPVPCYTQDYRVNAICTGCDTVHSVLMTNCRGGITAGCKSCRKTTGNISVLCHETQDTYCSIMRLCKSLGILNRYGSVRLCLHVKGIFNYEGFSYSLYD